MSFVHIYNLRLICLCVECSVSVCFLFVALSLVPSLWFSLLLFLSFLCYLQWRALSLLRWCVGSLLFPSALTYPSCVLERLVVDARWCVFHMYACLIVDTYVRVCLCVCSCVSVSAMLNLPVVVCRRCAVVVYVSSCACRCMCMYVCMECLCNVMLRCVFMLSQVVFCCSMS